MFLYMEITVVLYLNQPTLITQTYGYNVLLRKRKFLKSPNSLEELWKVDSVGDGQAMAERRATED